MLDTLSPAPLGAVPFVAFDTETTGLGEARVVEVAAIRFTAGVVVDELVTLVNPGVRIPADATAVHGITNRMVAGAPRAAEVLPRLLEFMRGAVPVAHHAPFDVRVLAAELWRVGLALPRVEVLDTRRICRRLFPGLGSYSLGALSAALGIPADGAHRARADALQVVRLLERCAEALRRGDVARPPVPPGDLARPRVHKGVRETGREGPSFGALLSSNGEPYSFDRAIDSSACIKGRPRRSRWALPRTEAASATSGDRERPARPSRAARRRG